MMLLSYFTKKDSIVLASRAYYASYQAMWAALGDPEEGKIWGMNEGRSYLVSLWGLRI